MKRFVETTVLTILTAFLLTGCGMIAQTHDMAMPATQASVMTDGVSEGLNSKVMIKGGANASPSDYSRAETGGDFSSSEADIVKNTMMIIRDADVDIDVKELDAFDRLIHTAVDDFEGYMEDARVTNYATEYDEYRYAYYTIRIPAEKLDDFLGSMDGEGSVTSKEISMRDVSLDYVDVEARIESYEKEKANLNRILDQADDVSDIIAIEDRLSTIQYNLDSAKSQKRMLEGRVSYSAVRLKAREKRDIEHPVRAAFKVNFKEKLIDGMEGAVTVFVSIITSIPVIVIITAFVILFLWLLRKVWRKVFGKKDIDFQYMLVPVVRGREEPDFNDLEDYEAENETYPTDTPFVESGEVIPQDNES